MLSKVVILVVAIFVIAWFFMQEDRVPADVGNDWLVIAILSILVVLFFL